MLFVLDAGSSITEMYIKNSIKGRPMFPNVGEDDPNAAFFIMNDPKAESIKIMERVKAGFMVRTRADADTREARVQDYSRLEAAIASGAQLISTDYYLDRLSPSGKFQISLKDGKYQWWNPLIAGIDCNSYFQNSFIGTEPLEASGLNFDWYGQTFIQSMFT